MRLKNKILLLILTFITSISFIACGGSDASFSDSETKVDITIPCITTPTATDIANYITLNSGDTIVQTTTTNTVISTYHDTDGVKKVCLVSGSAYILKA